MRCFGKFVSIAILTMVLAVVVLAVTCFSPTDPKEVTNRKEQEAEFKDLFGIAPTESVANIRYREKSSYIGGYQRWMSFTYDPAAYDAVLKANGYKLSEISMGGFANTPSAPVWWPKSDPPQAMLYSRSQDDTPSDEGYQFLEFMWHEASSGQVFFSKFYWD